MKTKEMVFAILVLGSCLLWFKILFDYVAKVEQSTYQARIECIKLTGKISDCTQTFK